MHIALQDSLRMRPLDDADADAAAALSRRLLWPLRPDDWRYLLSLAEGVAVESDDGVIGVGLSWKFNGGFGAISAVLVAQTHHGQGIETRIVEHLLAGLEGRSVFVHAPMPMVSHYESLGFVRRRTLHQHQGVAGMAPLVALDPGDRIRPLGRDDAAQLQQLDEQASGVPRGQVIRRLLDGGGCVMLENDGMAKGYAFCREAGRGWIIGPVAAPSVAGAKALIAYWAGRGAGKAMRVDTAADQDLSPWLESIGLEHVGTLSTLTWERPYTPTGSPQLWAMMLQSIV